MKERKRVQWVGILWVMSFDGKVKHGVVLSGLVWVSVGASMLMWSNINSIVPLK